ncbi:hypothetical protein BV22DRAFT_1131201 [Leucogyrophana mollusca]|uniref:Uncharacterized protein n=1 Tax=Leucogyrophana mollusca TaxID=85980 RepID=A0ACB8BD71_9AGAM|nr:hypothetical protein BV22DRAFT_1131201 [Leucogyrophana mollusca]
MNFDPPDATRVIESELGYLGFLQEAKVLMTEYVFPTYRIANVQLQLEKLIRGNFCLHQSAKDAYRSHVQSYASYSLKQVFDANVLNLTKIGKSFGFSIPPRVDLKVIGGGKSEKTGKAKYK